jgi:DNA-directed RNA polymerase subunit M/transcription elongation factor TFIIS
MIKTPSTLGHIHTYKRILRKGKRTSQFMCTHPTCPTTMDADLLAGKMSHCPYCSNDFIITRRKLAKQGLLHCDKCSSKKQKQENKIGALETKLLALLGETNDNSPIQDVTDDIQTSPDGTASSEIKSEDVRKLVPE